MASINGETDDQIDYRALQVTHGLWASPDLLESTSEDVASLWAPHTIRVLPEPPSSFLFLREYVSKSIPCIIQNTIMDTDGSSLHITLDDLVDMMICSSINDEQDTLLTVDVTPDGHGDCIRTVKCGNTTIRMCVTPEQRNMTMSEFRDQLRRNILDSNDDNEYHHHLEETDEHGRRVLRLSGAEPASISVRATPRSNQVLYYSKQNDCLRTELRPLFDKKIFPETVAFAEEAFGTGPPDAVNLWIGNEQAVSSMHKDHYENLFYVLSGEKVFTICPPSDAPFLYQSEFDSGCFRREENGEWVVVPAEDTPVQWIEADVDRRLFSESKYPLLSLAHPLKVHVRAGEMLYLPSLWFHAVTQTCETVGVNYWYNMHFDSPLWCYFNFMQQLQARPAEIVEHEEEQDHDSNVI